MALEIAAEYQGGMNEVNGFKYAKNGCKYAISKQNEKKETEDGLVYKMNEEE